MCLRYSKDDESEKAVKRRKREVASEDFYNFSIKEILEEEMSSSSSAPDSIDGLSSALLTSALDGGHKVKRRTVINFFETQLRFVIWMKR